MSKTAYVIYDFMKTTIISLLLFYSLSSEAKLLHIIHTNDLHSYFQGYKDGRGGYAKLKLKIDELKKHSAKNEIEVLQLDAGDFGEGTAFFLTKEGSASIEALGMLGTEVSVLGNHDHMLGGQILGDQIRKANVKTKFVSANLVQTQEMNLETLVSPYVDIQKAGTSIRVIGLSTAEVHYQYPLNPGRILPPIGVGKKLSRQAREEGKELIIALTHIGQKADKNLAKRSSEIDLIIGGHSHDRIEEVVYIKNKKNKNVPIVQAGAHGLVVGSLLIDIKDDKTIEVVKYKLHEILPPMQEDQDMADFVTASSKERNKYFGGRWDEVIGETLIPITGYKDGIAPTKGSCWGEHMAKMSQQATNSDLSIHLAQFEGLRLEPGPVTFGDMIESFPHFRKYGDYGWEISTLKVSGKALNKLLKAMIVLRKKGINFYLKPRIIYFKNEYTISFPSEIGHAVKQTIGEKNKTVNGINNSGLFYWDVMEKYIKENSPLECLDSKKQNEIKRTLRNSSKG